MASMRPASPATTSPDCSSTVAASGRRAGAKSASMEADPPAPPMKSGTTRTPRRCSRASTRGWRPSLAPTTTARAGSTVASSSVIASSQAASRSTSTGARSTALRSSTSASPRWFAMLAPCGEASSRGRSRPEASRMLACSSATVVTATPDWWRDSTAARPSVPKPWTAQVRGRPGRIARPRTASAAVARQ